MESLNQKTGIGAGIQTGIGADVTGEQPAYKAGVQFQKAVPNIYRKMYDLYRNNLEKGYSSTAILDSLEKAKKPEWKGVTGQISENREQYGDDKTVASLEQYLKQKSGADKIEGFEKAVTKTAENLYGTVIPFGQHIAPVIGKMIKEDIVNPALTFTAGRLGADLQADVSGEQARKEPIYMPFAGQINPYANEPRQNVGKAIILGMTVANPIGRTTSAVTGAVGSTAWAAAHKTAAAWLNGGIRLAGAATSGATYGGAKAASENRSDAEIIDAAKVAALWGLGTQGVFEAGKGVRGVANWFLQKSTKIYGDKAKADPTRVMELYKNPSKQTGVVENVGKGIESAKKANSAQFEKAFYNSPDANKIVNKSEVIDKFEANYNKLGDKLPFLNDDEIRKLTPIFDFADNLDDAMTARDLWNKRVQFDRLVEGVDFGAAKGYVSSLRNAMNDTIKATVSSAGAAFAAYSTNAKMIEDVEGYFFDSYGKPVTGMDSDRAVNYLFNMGSKARFGRLNELEMIQALGKSDFMKDVVAMDIAKQMTKPSGIWNRTLAILMGASAGGIAGGGMGAGMGAAAGATAESLYGQDVNAKLVFNALLSNKYPVSAAKPLADQFTAVINTAFRAAVQPRNSGYAEFERAYRSEVPMASTQQVEKAYNEYVNGTTNE